MKSKISIKFVSVKSKKNKYFEDLFVSYEKKIINYCRFSFKDIKSYEISRDQSSVKVEKESKSILKKIGDNEFVILFDETGLKLSSRKFASYIEDKLQIGQNISFIIGGAFGVSEEVKRKADLKLCLSSFVFNHSVAKLVALEQIYRAFTIVNGQPYHND